jgi:hypothetical protein
VVFRPFLDVYGLDSFLFLAIDDEGKESTPQVYILYCTHQGTFTEHSGNIQGTFREHSGNIQGTFREGPVPIWTFKGSTLSSSLPLTTRGRRVPRRYT